MNLCMVKERKSKRIKKCQLLQAFTLYDGNIMQCAEHFGVEPKTIYRYIARDEELDDALIESRKSQVIKRLDAAEYVLEYMLSQKKNFPRIALDTSKYVLEAHGKKRGYVKSKDEEPLPSRDALLDLENENMQLRAQLEAQKKINKKRSDDN